MGLFKHKKKTETKDTAELTYRRLTDGILFSDALCIHCAACLESCPMGALTFDESEMPVIDEEYCIQCNECVNNCLVDALEFFDSF